MKKMSTMIASLMGFMLVASGVNMANASHQVQALTANYQAQRAALVANYRASVEEVECARRDAIAALNAQKRVASQLCPQERFVVMRRLMGRKMAVRHQYRTEMLGVRNDFELRSRQLQRAYNDRLAQLRLRPTCASEVTLFDAPTCRPDRCGTVVPHHDHPHSLRQVVPPTVTEPPWLNGPLNGPRHPQHVLPEEPSTEIIAPDVIGPEVNIEATRWTSVRRRPTTLFEKLAAIGLRF